MSYQTNASALMNLLQSSQQYSTGDLTWLKLNAGTHRIRLCPPWSSEGTPVRMIVNHNGYRDKDNNQRNPMCFAYVFNSENIVNALLKNALVNGQVDFTKTVINQEDIKFFQKHGCIYCKISDIKSTMDRKNNKSYPKASFLFNVVNRADNKLYKKSFSKKQFEAISMFYSAFPTLFNVEDGIDLMLMASGEGLQRKYVLNVIPDKVPLGIDLTTTPLHDLDQTMSDGYKNLNETMELISNTCPNMLQLLGINPSTVMTPQI